MKKGRTIKRAISTGVIVIMLLAVVSSASALQGGNISQYINAYVNGTSDTPLKPDIVTLMDGTIAYAIEPAKVSTKTDTVYETYEESNTQLKKGIEIIMQYGYPLNSGPNGETLDASDPGVAADKARYATAIAIQAWAIHNGASAPTGWADFVESPSSLVATEGCESVVSYIRYLLDKAKGQIEIPHGVTAIGGNGSAFTEIKMEETSSGYEAGFTVKLQNINKGYVLDMSVFPTTTQANGYTGEDGDNVTIKLGSTVEDSYTLKFKGKDTRLPSNYKFYTPTNQSDTSKLVAMAMTAPYESEEVAEYTLKISKNSGEEWSFAQTESAPPVEEPTPKPNGSFAPVDGSLVVYDYESGQVVPGAGLSVKNAQGTEVKQAKTDDKGCVSISDLPAGKYTVNQSSPAPGFMADKNTYKFGVITSTANTMYKGNTVLLNVAKRITIVLKNGDKPLPGVKFTLKSRTGSPMSATTNETGRAVFIGLQNGTYTITFESAPEDTPKDQLAAMQKLSREVFITDEHDNNTAIYTFDIAELIGNKKAKTGEAEVLMALRVCFFLSVLGLACYGMCRIIDPKNPT